MGGNISVSSEYGKGSTFTVTLPQNKRSDEVLASVNNPDKIKVLVYERREIYANSFAGTLGNLGVACTLISEDSDFCEEITNKLFTHIFIPFMLFEGNIDSILKHGKGAKIVVLAEFGDVITNMNYSVLAMPAYSVSIANILNGITGNFLYNEDGSDIIRFTAPNAKVLIVDDIQTNLKVAQGLLLPYKMDVDLCLSGREALKAAAAKRYDLIFMDHKMPEMDGFETTMRLRKMNDEDEYDSSADG
jgi:ActR/RegA family two-component response regulator